MIRFAVLLALAACGDKPASSLVIKITADGKPIAARIVLLDHGKPMQWGDRDLFGQRQGKTACRIDQQTLLTLGGIVVGEHPKPIPIGTGRCEILPGTYRAIVWHGFEYERWTGEIDLTKGGAIEFDAGLTRAWAATGTVAGDFHVHASQSNDSTMPDEQRVLALVASGIQIAAIANHNVYGDVDTTIHAMGYDGVIDSIASSELTSESLHVGAYPVPKDQPPPKADTLVHAGAAEMFAIARAMPTKPIIQVNHPRFRYGALFDLTKWDGLAWPPPFPLDFDAVEVIAGYSANNMLGDMRIDDGVRDLYTLTAHGKLVAAMGNSDTHDFNWVLDGVARTYVYSDMQEDHVIDAIRARRTVATTCPFLDVQVGDAGPGQLAKAPGKIKVIVDVRSAAFCEVTRLRIQVGDKIDPIKVESVDHVEREYDVASDTFVGVIVDGAGTLPLEMTGTYQFDKWKKPGITPYAVISPILIDADGDGVYTAK